MKQRVLVHVPIYVELEIELSIDRDMSDDEILDLASEYAYLNGYAGNGAISGKLIGTSERHVSISTGEADFDKAKVTVARNDID